jgi:hypothetical protein
MMDLDAIKRVNERATVTGQRSVGWERKTGLNDVRRQTRGVVEPIEARAGTPRWIRS